MILVPRGLQQEYFQWLCDKIGGGGISRGLSYHRLLDALYSTPFRYTILRDRNREADGIDMRYRFACVRGIDFDKLENEFHGKRCSVFEMIVALAVRCEESIMDDASKGDRTGQWFWEMIVNLGLGSMLDSNFDDEYFDFVMSRFLDREYEPNGKGGLFTVRHCSKDLRKAEIWHQLCWHLNEIT